MSPSMRRRPRLPKFFISDIPPRLPGACHHPPEIYYGERTDQYVIVNTRLPEFDYPLGEKTPYPL